MTESPIRSVHPPALKSKVALDAIKEQKTLAELSSLYSVHPTQIKNWKQKALMAITTCFTETVIRNVQDQEKRVASLYQEIGRLKIEHDWLKKKMGLLES